MSRLDKLHIITNIEISDDNNKLPVQNVALDLGVFVADSAVNVDRISYGYEIILKPRYLIVNDSLCCAPEPRQRNIIELDIIGLHDQRLGADEEDRILQ